MTPDPGGRRTWSLRARLTALFTLAAAGVLLVASLAVVSFVHLTDTRRQLLGQIDPASLQSDQLFQAYLDEETGIRGYLLTRDSAFLQPYAQGVSAQRAASSRLRSALVGRPDLLRMVDDAEGAASNWETGFAVPVVLAGQRGSLSFVEQQLLGPGKAKFDVIRSRFAALDATLAAERTSTGAALSAATHELIVALVLGLALVLVAGVIIGRALGVWVVRPLDEVGSSVRQVAAGDLDHAVEPHGPPEIAHLAGDVEAMRLRIVSELEEVATARSDLAERNLDLSRSNEELEQFAYVASHDLQEPLRKVTSFVQLLQQRYEGELDDRADQYIAFAVDGSKRMQVLINDLLAFSRVGRVTEDFVPVDMTAAVREAVDGLADVITTGGAEVRVGRLPTVSGDPVLLTAVWSNLIGNAVKFRGEAPPVVTVEAAPDGEMWRFTVTDNGIGIEPRFADRVFVIFQRLHARDAYEGTGIGLALCKKIVEFHGGTIGVDTGYAGGARLHFTIPASAQGGAAWHVRETARSSSC